MTKLLICGSREASPSMLDYAVRCVQRAKERGYDLVVGDASGVDHTVAMTALQIGVPVHIYGIHQQPRNYKQLLTTGKHFAYTQVVGNFLARDRVMVDNADMVCGIWNKKSNGTRYTIKYALKKSSKTVFLAFEQNDHMVVVPRNTIEDVLS